MVWDTTAPLNDGSDIETENDKIHDNWAALETTLDVDHFWSIRPCKHKRWRTSSGHS